MVIILYIYILSMHHQDVAYLSSAANTLISLF